MWLPNGFLNQSANETIFMASSIPAAWNNSNLCMYLFKVFPERVKNIPSQFPFTLHHTGKHKSDIFPSYCTNVAGLNCTDYARLFERCYNHASKATGLTCVKPLCPSRNASRVGVFEPAGALIFHG